MTRASRTACLLALSFAYPFIHMNGQCANINSPETVKWVNSLINSTLGEDAVCRASAPDRDTFAIDHACNIFVGRVMARIYGLTTFASTGGTFLKANEIALLLPTWDGWIDLGSAGDQSVLNRGADAANQGSIVIAVWANPDPKKPGHVALIGPGPLKTSPRWGNLRTPVAAAFRLDDVESAFLGQPLACAFGPDKKTATHLWQYTKSPPGR